MALLGIDEVGRGPWAGPLVAGAAVLRVPVDGLADSKKLSKKRREELDIEIRANAWIGLGWVTPAEIDSLGMTKSVQLAMLRAVKDLHTNGGMYDEIIIDGNINYFANCDRLDLSQTIYQGVNALGLTYHTVKAVVGGDGLVPAVSAASIVAKVARDQYMVGISQKYPEYGFDKHVGYGTAAHMAALAEHGVTDVHRRSFKPVRKFINDL